MLHIACHVQFRYILHAICSCRDVISHTTSHNRFSTLRRSRTIAMNTKKKALQLDERR